MEWEPEEQAWLSYIKMELRYKELDHARHIYERFVQIHPEVKNWIRYARFEEQNGFISNSRNVYERAVEFFGESHMDEKLFIAFAKFEEGCREYERARTIYKYSLDQISKQQAQDLFKAYTQFEKKFGDRTGIEDVIISKRKFQYDEEVKVNPMNYDAWVDYIRLMETESSMEMTREVYERAISNVPPSQEKRHWRRYVYLWIYYALYEELIAKDMERTRQVYRACLEIIPHNQFTFAKIWLMYAHFEVRQKNVTAARKALGTALGKCPKPKIFRGYIDLELQLREFDRCRRLYEKFLEFSVANCNTWVKYAELEAILGDTDRARAIFNLAIDQPLMDMPEMLWKAYIDFELEQEEYDNVRRLYESLLERTQHIKVWLSYAKFEASLGSEAGFSSCRGVYERADNCLKGRQNNEERAMLLESWLDFEREQGSSELIEAVRKKLPRRVKKQRKIHREDGSDAGWEEYWDYVFPDDAASAPNLKLLQMARMWKHNKGIDSDSGSESESSESEESNDNEESRDNDQDTDYSEDAESPEN